MPRFNIALLPVDPVFHTIFEQLAISYFRDHADDYLLGAHALTHVTLCQFHAENAQIAASVFYAWSHKNPLDLKLGAFNIRIGTAEHTHKYFAEFLVQASSELIAMQSQCADHLIHVGLQPLTTVKGYTPHITLARLGKPMSAHFGLNFAYEEPILFQPAVGLSSETGMFIQRL